MLLTVLKAGGLKRSVVPYPSALLPLQNGSLYLHITDPTKRLSAAPHYWPY